MGEWVWRFYPPSLVDKVTGQPYTGPHQVQKISEDGSCITLLLPGVGRGGGLLLKEINVKNVKPLRFTRCGRMFIVLPPETADITVTLLVETAYCGYCSKLEGENCFVPGRRSTQILLLEIIEEPSFEEFLPRGWEDIIAWGCGNEHDFLHPVAV